MSNTFQASFAKGRQAAEMAREANAEINAVLRDLDAALCHESGGALKIELRKNGALEALVSIAEFFTNNIPGQLRPDLAWICARNPLAADESPRQLATWQRAATGYPCTIAYGTRNVTCEDREALTIALNELLEDAWIGSQLELILALPRKSSGEPAKSPD